jgi:hypothetical protein
MVKSKKLEATKPLCTGKHIDQTVELAKGPNKNTEGNPSPST